MSNQRAESGRDRIHEGRIGLDINFETTHGVRALDKNTDGKVLADTERTKRRRAGRTTGGGCRIGDTD